MTSIDVLENKISSARKYLTIIKDFQNYSKDEISKNVMLTGAIERFLYLAIQAAIDLCEALISYKKFRKPSTYAEAFETLMENKVIEADLNEQLRKMCGFRNIIAHDYEEVNNDIIYKILTEDIKDIQKFVDIIEKQI